MAEREINSEIAALDATLKSIEAVLDLGKLRKEQAELELQAGAPDLWSNPERAQRVTSALSRVNSTIK
jgi:peptide chain release factor 2